MAGSGQRQIRLQPLLFAIALEAMYQQTAARGGPLLDKRGENQLRCAWDKAMKTDRTGRLWYRSRLRSIKEESKLSVCVHNRRDCVCLKTVATLTKAAAFRVRLLGVEAARAIADRVYQERARLAQGRRQKD